GPAPAPGGRASPGRFSAGGAARATPPAGRGRCRARPRSGGGRRRDRGDGIGVAECFRFRRRHKSGRPRVISVAVLESPDIMTLKNWTIIVLAARLAPQHRLRTIDFRLEE